MSDLLGRSRRFALLVTVSVVAVAANASVAHAEASSKASSEVADGGQQASVTPSAQQTASSEKADLKNGAAPAPSAQLGGEEIIVTAQKRSETTQKVPISISVLSGRSLDQSTYSGITEALNTVPGVSAFATQVQMGGTELSFRGVSAAGGILAGASTVAEYIDSVPFGFIRTALVPDTNVFDLDRVEVLRGPQGTLYGANALNGVVRILTKDPDLDRLDLKAHGVLSKTDGGVGANYGGDLAVNVPLVDDVLAIRAVISDDHYSGWIFGPLGRGLNHGDDKNDRIKLKWKPTDATTVVLSAWHSEQSDNAPDIAAPDGNNYSTNAQPRYSQFNTFSGRIAHDFGSFTASSDTSYILYKGSNLLDYSPLQIPGFDETLGTNVSSRVFTEEVNLSSAARGPWRWSVGAMYRNDKDDYFQPAVVYTPLPSGGVQVDTSVEDAFHDVSKSWAVYGELGRRFLDDTLELSVGLRYFHDANGTQADPSAGPTVPQSFSGNTSKAVTPRVVLTWTPTSSFTGYASYSQGFRSGIPQDYLVTTFAPQFPALKPDRLTSYEVGAKGTLFNGLLTYQADVYDLYWKDVQQQLSVTLPGSPIFFFVLANGGTVRGHGTELSVTVRPVAGLTIIGNLGLNNLHFVDTIYSGGAVLFPAGNRPSDSPATTAGVSANYTFSLGGGYKGVLSGDANYISALTTGFSGGAQAIASPLFRANAKFGVTFPGSHWSVAAFVDNLNNYRKSQAPLATTGIFSRFNTYLRPRTIGLTLDYRLH